MLQMRFLYVYIPVIIIVNLFHATVYAQNDNYFYIRSSGGISTYLGDFSHLDSEEVIISYAFRGGIGYSITRHIAFGLDYRFASYPRINRSPFGDYKRSHTSNVYLKYSIMPDRTVSVYAIGGAGMTFYGTYERRQGIEPAFGSLAGLGIDIGVSDQVVIYLEGTMDLIFNSGAYNPGGDGSAFDALGFAGIGVRVNLRPTTKPVTGLKIVAPDTVRALHSVRMETTYDGNPAGEVSYSWHFGDGNRSAGSATANVYRNPGIYTVVVNLSDRKGTHEARKDIVVLEEVEKAVIQSMRTEESIHIVNDPVTFIAEVTGSEPMEFEWDFGDGNTSTEKSPKHIYNSEGTYTVTLEVTIPGVTGDAGVAVQSITIDVHDPEPIEID